MKTVEEPLWTAEETALYLRIPKATLYQWRYLGIGPKAGRRGTLAHPATLTDRPERLDRPGPGPYHLR